MARRRGLSPEDRRLWDQVAASATPLKPSPPRPIEPAPASERPLPTAPRATASVAPPRKTPPREPEVGAFLDRAHPHMDSRRFDKLRRGRMEPEARLDLHGMTSARAHAALIDFLLSAHARDLRLVLVITGKGQPDDSPHQPRRHGVLRHSLPHWLAAPPLTGRILQVAPAHARHGGGGAFYVYLRRRR
jgi:DNA-nicking Smr family endonuclease